MFVKFSIFICFQALLLQGFSAQCIGAYNGFAAENSPAFNSLAWEAAAPYGNAASCTGSAFSTGTPYTSGSWASAPFEVTGWGAGYSPASLAASNGGGLAITSASPIAPTGVSMNSDNIYEGPLAVSGAVPFLGAVALEGVLPTAGAGSVAYGCGNGNVAILNENYNSGYGTGYLGAGIATPAYGYNGCAGPVVLEAGVAGSALGYNGIAGIRSRGCGCGAVF